MDKEGVLQICKVVNTASPGYMPTEKLVVLRTVYYRKRTVGYARMYAALGANQTISLVVRCFNTDVPTYSEQLYVVFPNEETDNQFMVSGIQEIVEEEAIDLTLSRMEEYYDLNTDEAITTS